MFNAKIMTFLFLVNYTHKMQLSYNYEETSPHVKNISGNDERFNIANNDSVNMDKLSEISANILKKDLLEILNNSNTNIYNKLYIIEKYMLNSENHIKSYNLTAGNLFRDFYDNTTEAF